MGHEGASVLYGNAMCYDFCSNLKLSPNDDPLKCVTVAEKATDDCKLADPKGDFECKLADLSNLAADEKATNEKVPAGSSCELSPDGIAMYECKEEVKATDAYKTAKAIDPATKASKADMAKMLNDACGFPDLPNSAGYASCKVATWAKTCADIPNNNGRAVSIKTMEDMKD